MSIIDTVGCVAEELSIEVDRSIFAGRFPVSRDAPQDRRILTNSPSMAIIAFATIKTKVTVVRLAALCDIRRL